MGFLDSVFNALQSFAESDTAKRLAQMAEESKAREIERTTGINGLRCSISNLETGYGLTTCEGEVRNIGRSEYQYVEVIVSFFNEEGRIIDKGTDSVVYRYTSSTLCPGESRPFTVRSSAKNISRAKVSIKSFEEV